MLSIWPNSRLNKKSSRTLHPVTLTVSASPTKRDAKPWMSKVRNLSEMMLESCAWMTGPSKLPGKNTIAPLECRVRLGPGLPHGSLSRGRPVPSHTIWAGDQGHQADEMWQGCWYITDCSWKLKASGVEGAQQIRDLIENIIHSGKIPTEWEESIIVSLYKGKGVLLEEITQTSNC